MALDEGFYGGKVREWGFGTSRTGTPYFEVVTRLDTRRLDGGEEVELEFPVRRSVRLYLSPAAMEMSVASIRALGYEGETLARLDPDHPQAVDLFDKDVVVRVKHEEYQGRVQEKLYLYKAKPKTVHLRSSDLADLDALDAAFAAAQEKALAKAAEKDRDAEDAAEEAPDEAPDEGEGVIERAPSRKGRRGRGR